MLPSLAGLSPCPVRLSPKAGRARRKEEVSRLKGWVLVAQDAFTTDRAKNPSESTSILVNAAQMANGALSFNEFHRWLGPVNDGGAFSLHSGRINAVGRCITKREVPFCFSAKPRISNRVNYLIHSSLPALSLCSTRLLQLEMLLAHR